MNIKYYLLALCSSVIFISPFSHADNCHVAQANTNTFSFGTVIAQRDSPVGTVLASSTWASTVGSGRAVTCTSRPASLRYKNYLGGSTSVSHAYSTNRPGVGIIVMDSGNNYFENYVTSWTIDDPAKAPGLDWGRRFTVSVVKTGDLVSGSVSQGTIAKAWADLDSESNPYLTLMLDTFFVQQVACSVTTRNMVFPIGNILATQFGSTIGTTPAVAQNTQNLGLSCDPYANVNISLSGTLNPDVANNSVLALTGQGSQGVATGVGVQILYNGNPLMVNNRIVLRQSAGGQESFPLTARYYQTRSAVTTGSANTSATLNITYQ